VPAIDFLVHELSIPRATIPKLLFRKPQLLAYSISGKLRPAVAFFIHELGVSGIVTLTSLPFPSLPLFPSRSVPSRLFP